MNWWDQFMPGPSNAWISPFGYPMPPGQGQPPPPPAPFPPNVPPMADMWSGSPGQIPGGKMPWDSLPGPGGFDIYGGSHPAAIPPDAPRQAPSVPPMPGIGIPNSTNGLPDIFGGSLSPIMPRRAPNDMQRPASPPDLPQMPTLRQAPLPAVPELNSNTEQVRPVSPMGRPVAWSDSRPLPGPSADVDRPNPLPTERFGYAPGAAPSTGERVHFGVRNNNPLNIMGDPAKLSGVYKGVTGNYETRPGMSYLKFDTPEAGIAAAAQTIRYHAGKGADTPAKLMQILAPDVPGHGNNPAAYGNIVAKALGVGPNDKVDFRDPAVLQKVLPAIFQTETGMRNLPYTPEMYASALSGQPGTRNMVGLRDAPSATSSAAPEASPAAPAASPEATGLSAAAPTQPGWMERNGLGKDSSFWGFLSQTGAGLGSAAPGENFLGAANRGLAMGNQYLREGPRRQLEQKLLEAQVGKVEADADTRKALKAVYNDKSLPGALRLIASTGNVDKFIDAFMKLDPATQQVLAQNEAVKAAMTTTATEKAKKAIDLAPETVAAEATKVGEIEKAKTLAQGGNEGQRKAAAFAARAEGAEKNLAGINAQGFTSPRLMTWMTSESPYAAFVASGPEQKYFQAAREFISAVLRQDSGAAVPEVEFKRYFSTYFPVPGDGPDVMQAKQQARQRVIAELKALGGPANANMPSSAPSQGIPAGWKVTQR
jgi:hypothetical protein